MPWWCQENDKNRPSMDGLLIQCSQKACWLSSSITPSQHVTSQDPDGNTRASSPLAPTPCHVCPPTIHLATVLEMEEEAAKLKD